MHSYQLGDKIGHGGMGEVYQAKDLDLDRDVAIKFMDAMLVQDSVACERFLREARILAKIDHPNVVRVIGAGKWTDGRPYFVMELIKGEPLSALVKKGALPEAEAVDIICQSLGALAEAHSHGIVHRDIKSSNILICPGRKVKLIDFGIARNEDLSSVTSTGKIIGTPAYMSPEQAMGERVGPASDLYSLGIVFYEMLSGRVPFRAETPVAILRMHTDNPPPSLDGHFSKVSRIVAAKALEKRPERRFATANAMLEALQAQSRPAPQPSRPKVAASPKTPRIQDSNRAAAEQRSNKTFLFGGLAALIVGGSLVAAWASGAFGGDKEPGTFSSKGALSPNKESGPKADPKAAETSQPRSVTEDVAIPFETTRRNNPNLNKGQTRVVQEGRQGKKALTFRVSQDSAGKETKVKVGEQIVSAPRNRIIEVGTKQKEAAQYASNCPQCGERYPAGAMNCPNDGTARPRLN